jgi:hypothetical protein
MKHFVSQIQLMRMWWITWALTNIYSVAYEVWGIVFWIRNVGELLTSYMASCHGNSTFRILQPWYWMPRLHGITSHRMVYCSFAMDCLKVLSYQRGVCSPLVYTNANERWLPMLREYVLTYRTCFLIAYLAVSYSILSLSLHYVLLRSI